MSVRRIKAGTPDVSVVLRIVDASDGTPETGVVFNTSGIDLWYRREGAASVDITEADLATPALTDAHTDGGFLHINDGYCRLDLPDAACATGATGVQIGGTVTGMVVLAPYIELVAYDPYDTVRLGLTALPGAAADAAGGLPISDAGGLDLDTLNSNVSAIVADTNELQTDDTPGALAALDAKLDTIDDLLDTEVAAILADTNELQTDWANGGRLDLILDARASQASVDTIDTNVDAILVDTATTLQAELDGIQADTEDIQSRLPAALVSGRMASNVAAIADNQAAADNLSAAARTIVRGSAITGTLETTACTTDLTEATSDHYNGRVLLFYTGVLAGQATDITDYDGATKTLTYTALTEAPGNGDLFTIV